MELHRVRREPGRDGQQPQRMRSTCNNYSMAVTCRDFSPPNVRH